MKEVSAKKEEKKKGTKSTEEDFCSISILVRNSAAKYPLDSEDEK